MALCYFALNTSLRFYTVERTRVQLEQEENIEGKDTTFINANFIGVSAYGKGNLKDNATAKCSGLVIYFCT